MANSPAGPANHELHRAVGVEALGVRLGDRGDGVGHSSLLANAGFREATRREDEVVAASVAFKDDDGRRVHKLFVRATAEF